MERKDLNLSSFTKSFIKSQVIITCSGVDPSFSIYQHALTSHFARNPVVWKKNSKIFPHLLTFSLKFTKFDDKLCFGPTISPLEIKKIAYLHVFNICVSNVDDYRVNVRHNVSDWFAKVNTKPDVQWVIIINSTNVKDKKTKNAILDKIKNDFSKYQNKLLEIADPTNHNSFISFTQNIQQFLFNHLNLVIDIWDHSLKTAFEKRKQNNWDPFQYFVSMTEYAKYHWSFGAIEFAISVFDDLEQLLNEFVVKGSQIDSPKWLSQFLNVTIEDRPNLIKHFELQQFEKSNSHYLGIRNYLLCQQIMINIHLYLSKMKSNDAAPSLRSDCAIEILRKTLICIDAVEEFNLQMNNQRDVHKTCCWIWWTIYEALDICTLICDISHLNIASSLVSRLHLTKFNALHLLLSQIKSNSQEVETLKNWLKINETETSKRLKTIIEENENMGIELEHLHDVCVNSLNYSNRHRQSLHTTFKLFSFLREIQGKVPVSKLAINQNHLNALPFEKSSANFLRNLCQEYFEAENIPNKMNLFPILFFISMCENEEKNIFLENVKKLEKPLNWESISVNDFFVFRIEPFNEVQTTDSKFFIKLKIFSKLNFVLEKSKVALHFTSSNSANIVEANNSSILSLLHEEKEKTARFVSELKMRKSINSDEQFLSFDVESTSFNLFPGDNEIIIESNIREIGFFVIENVQMTSINGILNYKTTKVLYSKPPVLFSISTPHSVTISNEFPNKPFLAGILQKIEIEIEAKCEIENGSELNISSCSKLFKFLDKNRLEWIEELNVKVEKMSSFEKKKIELLVWLKIDSNTCETASLQKKVLKIEWMKQKYAIPLVFVPIMVISSKTSMMTTDVLLEVEINRSTGSGITILIEKASLDAIDICDQIQSAEPITKYPTKCEMLSVMNLVWKLPIKGSSVKHRLKVIYKVENNFDDFGVDENQINQLEYSFDDEVELTVPEVKFEICTQILSQQPGAQLCRASSPCHFVISIRCLNDTPCALFVVLDADERIWSLTERTKMITVKENGLGQSALSIVPCVAGYLPFPSVSVYECQQTGGITEAWIPGQEMLCFNRTAGKQIRVLSGTVAELGGNMRKNDSNLSSNRIANKIVKLFD